MDASIPAAGVKIEVDASLTKSHLQIRTVGRASQVTNRLRIAIVK